MTTDADATDQRRRWHIERSVNLGHILTTLIMAASVLAWANRMDTRVTVLETTHSYLSLADQKLDRDTQDRITLLRDELKEINRKLDRLIDGKNERRNNER